MVAASSNNSSRKSGGGDIAPSPWAQVVRAADSVLNASSSAAAQGTPSSHLPLPAGSEGQTSNNRYDTSAVAGTADATSPDYSAVETQAEGGSINVAKKPPWNKPSDGSVDVGSVMGGEIWPALSASAPARASPKSSSDSLKALSDGSASASQGTAIQSTQEQLITNNTNPGFTPHHGTYRPQKSLNRGGGSSSGAAMTNGGFAQPAILSAGLVGQGTNNSGRTGSTHSDPSPRDHAYRETGQRGGLRTQSHNGRGHDHPHQQCSTFRRGNPHPRGDGSSHPNYRARSEQDRGNHDWNSPRNFSSREAHMQPQRGVSRGVIQPLPHGLSPYMAHPMPIPPIGNPMVYPEVPPPMMYAPVPEAFRSVPILSPMSPRLMFLPAQLLSNILTQIHYYFSDSNLCKDIYLRKNMDEEGWVPIELIAGFKKVRELTDNVQIILDVLSTSTEVEVQGDKIRKRNDWKKWIMPSSVQFSTVSSPRSMGNPIHDHLVPNIKSLSLEERTGTPGAFLGRSSSGDLSSSTQRSTGEGTSQDNAKSSY